MTIPITFDATKLNQQSEPSVESNAERNLSLLLMNGHGLVNPIADLISQIGEQSGITISYINQTEIPRLQALSKQFLNDNDNINVVNDDAININNDDRIDNYVGSDIYTQKIADLKKSIKIINSTNAYLKNYKARTDRVSGAYIPSGSPNPTVMELMATASTYNRQEEDLKNKNSPSKDNFSPFFATILESKPILQQILDVVNQRFVLRVDSSVISSKTSSLINQLKQLIAKEDEIYAIANDKLSKAATGPSVGGLYASDPWIKKLMDEALVVPNSDLAKNLTAFEKDEDIEPVINDGKYTSSIEKEKTTREEIQAWAGDSTDNTEIKNKVFLSDTNTIDANMVVGNKIDKATKTIDDSSTLVYDKDSSTFKIKDLKKMALEEMMSIQWFLG